PHVRARGRGPITFARRSRAPGIIDDVSNSRLRARRTGSRERDLVLFDGQSRASSRRLRAATTTGLVGVAAYNWWIVVPFRSGLLKSPNGFFSDLEVSGRPDA